MNKPITQLELVPAAKIDDSPPTSNFDQTNLAAGVPPATAERTVAEAGLDDFDWSNDDAVVVKPRPGIAVYENKFGDVVVRTQHTAGDEDFFAYIPAEGLAAVITALKEYLP
jgi:hypothetical protein